MTRLSTSRIGEYLNGSVHEVTPFVQTLLSMFCPPPWKLTPGGAVLGGGQHEIDPPEGRGKDVADASRAVTGVRVHLAPPVSIADAVCLSCGGSACDWLTTPGSSVSMAAIVGLLDDAPL